MRFTCASTLGIFAASLAAVASAAPKDTDRIPLSQLRFVQKNADVISEIAPNVYELTRDGRSLIVGFGREANRDADELLKQFGVPLLVRQHSPSIESVAPRSSKPQTGLPKPAAQKASDYYDIPSYCGMEGFLEATYESDEPYFTTNAEATATHDFFGPEPPGTKYVEARIQIKPNGGAWYEYASDLQEVTTTVPAFTTASAGYFGWTGTCEETVAFARLTMTLVPDCTAYVIQPGYCD